MRLSIAGPVKPAVGPRRDGGNAVVYATDADYLFGAVLDAARVGSFLSQIMVDGKLTKRAL